MLDSETKRRIDTCRDILVGKVPDPKSQVEQITVALIYKFMDDMDLQSEEMGGRRKFFTADFERYRWANLVAPGVSGQDMLNTYSEALTKMVENDKLPALFRSIFRNAYLPYRDPETLRSFLREINAFTYDHSEKLGDAFEYLLSVLGSQGDAGQFRTPRHIIDFMVDIIAPKKDEVILDPACGTAGFLISAYKHILKANSTAAAPENGKTDGMDAAELALESPMRFAGDLLSAKDRERLARNIKGYDISPDMVRLSLVNLYLHGFADPKVEEYDTLTSEDKWTEMADVIFANPPFMSPKGGIKPHTRFKVESKRSEVLFVDYIAEHLTPNGRAAIVVPEGIIFQSQTAYVQLRKMLVENFLAAVISLPAGVFNPYSGVKTSILILDRIAAKASDHVAFFKIENDGFQLGAQRRAQRGSQLPQVKSELSAWLDLARGGAGDVLESTFGFAVPRDKIGESSELNLSGERYRPDSAALRSVWAERLLGELCEFKTGGTPTSSVAEYYQDGSIPWLVSGDIHQREIFDCEKRITLAGMENSNARPLSKDSVLIALNGQGKTRGTVALLRMANATCNQSLVAMTPKQADELLPEFLFWMLHSMYKQIRALTGDNERSGLNIPLLKGISIPLPPLEVQREIVAEIQGYQRVIDGARAVIDNYRPHISVDPSWEPKTIGDIAVVVRGSSPRPQGDPQFFGGPVPRLMIADITRDGMFVTPSIDSLTELGASKSRPMKRGEVVMAVSGNPGLVAILATDCCIHDGFVGFRELSPDVLPEFLYSTLMAQHERNSSVSIGAVFKNLTSDQVRDFKLRIPPRAIQEAIVADIKTEQVLVNGNRDLIARFEKKIDAAIARVWGEANAEAV